MEEIVFLNGRFIAKDEARLSLFSPGFLCGWGLFETMRAYNNKIVYLDSHLKRIKRSCQLIKIKFPYSLSQLKEIIQRAVKINGFRDAYVRLTLCKSDSATDISVIVKKYKPYPSFKYKQGFRTCIAGLRQNENYLLARLKTTNHLFYQLAYLQAKRRGFEEAIILNNRGYICEGSRSNLFFVKDSGIFTPALECGCLDGITRKVVFDLTKKYSLKINEGNFTLPDLYSADEAFLTNSLMGIMPLAGIEKQPIPRGRITQFLMREYSLLLKNAT